MKDIKDMTLEEVKDYCKTHEDCDGCPFGQGVFCEFGISAPCGWDLGENDDDEGRMEK